MSICLCVQAAAVSSSTGVLPINIPGLQIPAAAQTITNVLCLMNMVTTDELQDDEEYEGERSPERHVTVM